MNILITGSVGYIGSYFTKQITTKFKNINFIAIAILIIIIDKELNISD